MTPGIGEEVGQTARSAVGAIATNPVSVGLVFCNLALIAMLFYIVHLANKERAVEQTAQTELHKLLVQCTIPAK